MIRCRLLGVRHYRLRAFLSSVVGVLLAGALIAGGCGDDEDAGGGETAEPETSGVVDPVRRHQAEKIPPHEIAEMTQRLGGRVNEVRGTVTRGDAPLAVDDVFAQGDVIQTGEDGKAVIDLVREMRIEIGPSAHVTRGELREGELFLHAGALRAELPPIGGGSRPPLRVGTAAGAVVLGSAGHVMIAALPSGDAWIVAFSGAAEISRGEIRGEGQDRSNDSTMLLEGQAIVLGRSEIAEPTEAPDRVDAGWTSVAALMSANGAPPADRTALVVHARGRYDEAAEWLGAELERGEALADEQREAVGSDPARARELTREIVAHSQRRVRLKKIALGRYEQLAAALGFAGAGVDSERLERASELLGD